jgi:hypothetical protein
MIRKQKLKMPFALTSDESMIYKSFVNYTSHVIITYILTKISPLTYIMTVSVHEQVNKNIIKLSDRI